MLADEPTGNLDSDSTEQVYGLLRKVNQESGTAFTIVTHDRHIAEKSDRVIEMKDETTINDYLTSEKFASELWQCLRPGNCKLLQLLESNSRQLQEAQSIFIIVSICGRVIAYTSCFFAKTGGARIW